MLVVVLGHFDQAIQLFTVISHVAFVPAFDDPHDAGHYKTKRRNGTEGRHAHAR